MRIVEFTVNINTINNTIELPDNPSLFSSMHLDSASGRMQAVYYGDMDHFSELGYKGTPKWHNDTLDWWQFHARRYKLTKKEYNLMFTPSEYAAIQEALVTDPVLGQLWSTLQVVDYIDLEDPITINGMQYLLSKGLLTSDRYGTILRGLPDDGQDPSLGK